MLTSCCSDAGGGVEAGVAGAGGRVGALAQGARHVRGTEAGAALPSGVQDQYRPRGTAAVPRLLLQGTLHKSTGSTILDLREC